MNTITVAVAELLKYKKESSENMAISIGENEHGKYMYFRVKESRGKSMPNYFLCLLNGDNEKLFQRIEHMKLIPGDLVSIEGSLDMYTDKLTKKSSFRILIKDIDYAVKRKKETPESTIKESSPVSIDLNEVDPFIKKVDY